LCRKWPPAPICAIARHHPGAICPSPISAPVEYFNKHEAAHQLAQATGASEARLTRCSRKPYVLVAQRATPDTLDRIAPACHSI
jgi:hypothetical protein